MLRRSFHSLIVLLPLALAGCSSVPPAPAVDVSALTGQANASLARGELVLAREQFSTLVQATNGAQRQRMQIQLAQTELALGDAQAALATLDSILPPLSGDLALTESATRAQTLFALGQTVAAVRLLAERDLLLNSADAILANQALIWDGLSTPAGRVGAVARTGDPTVDGWLALAPLTMLAPDSNEFVAGLAEWRTEFGSHPAVSGILAEQLLAVRPDSAEPARMALLLPVGAGSPFSPQARAVRDGFMAAHFASGNLDLTTVTLYDTSQRGGAQSYRDALLDGADFIVGPLVSDEIPQVLAQAGFVPTLALNVSAGETVAVPLFYQFALASDDEIEAIAARAIAAGQRTAAVLHANSNFGYNVSNNFRAAFEARGGTVVASRVYAGNSANLSAPVEELLNVSQSEARYNRLRQVIGRRIDDFQPRRRGDIDMVFVQIDQPEVARLLVPLIEAYTADEIPTYSTRDVYDPTRQTSNNELDGLMFPDLPLLLQPLGEARIAADALNAYSNAYSDQFPREFAFGFDAYKLAEKLYSQGAADWPLAGATGELYPGANGRIRRVLPIAEFSGGRPQVTEATADLIGTR